MSAPIYNNDQAQSVNTSLPPNDMTVAEEPGWFRYIQQWVMGWLTVEHQTNGAHKSNFISTSMIQDNSVTASKIAAGVIGSSKVLQTVRGETSANTAIPNASAIDEGSVPGAGDGVEVLSQVVTPLSATSKLLVEVEVRVGISSNNSNGVIVTVFRDGNTAPEMVGYEFINTAGSVKVSRMLVTGSMTATTLKVRCGASTSFNHNMTLNQSKSGNSLGGSLVTSITVQEVA